MSKRAMAAVLGSGLALAGTSLAIAQSGTIRPAPDRAGENRRAALKLARAVTDRPAVIRRAAFSALPPFSNPAAISTRRLAGFPLRGSAFAILSTGNALDARRKNTSPSTSTSLGGPSVRGSRDVTIFRVDLNVPRKATCLSVRFRFLTEEYPEFVGTPFNDAFIAELDTSNWSTAGKDDPTITAPGNFAHDTEGNLISVNAAGDATVRASRARGTTYDGATRRLRASTPVTPGKHILYLSIFDQGDREYDSAVFVDRITLDRRKPCRSGAVAD